MYSLIESGQEILRAQRTLAATIKKDFRKTEVKNIGWQAGGKQQVTLNTSGQYWYWTTDHGKNTPNARYLNWFGVRSEGPSVAITAEINTPFNGRNDMVAGFFARHNQSGRIYLFHSGRVGGGAKGVGMKKFLAWSALKPEPVFDSDGKPRYGIVVMPIDGAGATQSAKTYVQRIVEFKEAVRAGTVDSPEVRERERLLHDYYSEPSGRRTGRRRAAVIDYVSRHGEVVEALAQWRKDEGLRSGEKLVKNVLVDLGVKRSGALAEVYEVKTSAGRGDVYTAIGQLTVHAASDDCERIIVLPAEDGLASDLASALTREGIRLKRYRLTESAVEILG